jgi:ribulose bisphosphate carboxylase small subunit
MKKTIGFVALLFVLFISQAYGQHRVNDIRQYKGWFKINIELDSNDNIQYNIAQCYPNGDEYKLNSNERRQLPLFMKIFCIGISEEVLKGQMESMTFSQDGIYMRMMGFTFIIDFSKSDDEILESLGQEMVNKYKYRNW